MNLCRCEKGHFYDREKYAVCPHCAGGGDVDTKRTEAFSNDVPTGGVSQMAPPPDQGFVMGAPLTGRMDYAPYNAPPVMAGAQPVAPNVPPGMMGVPPVMPNMPPMVPEMPADQMTVPIEVTDTVGNMADFRDFGGAEDSDDHTVGFFDDVFPQAGEPPAGGSPSAPKANPKPAPKPAAHMQTPNIVSTPCVGWLVPLGGAHIGASFTLKVGKNFIGRGMDMDVALTGEKSVSRERHAIVIYEPRESIFLVQPGESSSLTYHNNKVVLMPVQLEAYDTITVGDVGLLFLPLCGKRFQWGELLEAMKNKNNG